MTQGKGKIFSIFHSISGEYTGLWEQGTWAYFVRMSGCNLNCRYCDTEASIDGTHYKEMDVVEVVNTLENHRKTSSTSTSNLIITGGEPLIQNDFVFALIDRLVIMGYKIAVETNGSVFPDIPETFHVPDSFVFDYKMPCSGEMSKMLSFDNFTNIVNRYDSAKHLIKFVVQTEEDFLSAIHLIRKMKEKFEGGKHPQFIVSPCLPLTGKRLYELMCRCNFYIPINLQLHKFINLQEDQAEKDQSNLI